MHHWTKRNRSTSWVPNGPARSNDAFPRSVVAGAAIPSIICSFVLPECMVVGKLLPLYISFTGQPNPKDFCECKYSPYLEDENIFQKSASMVQIIMKYRIEQRRPIFDSPQNKTKNFPSGILIQIGTVWDFPIQPGSI